MRHRRLQIIAERVPARQHRAALDARFEQAERGRLRDLERADYAVGQAFTAQGIGIGGQQRPDPAEASDQRLGLRLGVAARDGEGQQIFDQFMIEQRVPAAVEQSLTQASAVARPV